MSTGPELLPSFKAGVLIKPERAHPSNEHCSKLQVIPAPATLDVSPSGERRGSCDPGTTATGLRSLIISASCVLTVICGAIAFNVLSSASTVFFGFFFTLGLQTIISTLLPHTFTHPSESHVTVSLSLEYYGAFWIDGVVGATALGTLEGLWIAIYAEYYARPQDSVPVESGNTPASSKEILQQKDTQRTKEAKVSSLFANALILLTFIVIPLGGVLLGREDAVTSDLWCASALNLLGAFAHWMTIGSLRGTWVKWKTGRTLVDRTSEPKVEDSEQMV